jgi:RNA polymerase sigma factor (sigma-70 family)
MTHLRVLPAWRTNVDYEALFAACGRVRAGDFSAFHALHELVAVELFTSTKRRFPNVDSSVVTDAVTDTLLKFATAPDCCRASTGVETFAFFRTVARNKVMNSLRSAKRQRAHETEAVADGRDVEVPSREVSAIQEEEDAEREAHIAALERQLLDPRDRDVFRLLLSGERSTTAYAQVLGIAHLSVDEQRHIVKQTKDRLMKFLKRTARRA